MTTIPVIETKRLILRGWDIGDLDSFFALYEDRQYASYVSSVETRWQAFEKLAALIGHWHMRGFGRFSVREKSTGKLIGHCGGSQIDGNREHEMNYTFHPDIAGQGYASEAVISALRYFYTKCGWVTAVSEIHPENTRSIALAKRLGAAFETTRTKDGVGYQMWRHLSSEVLEKRFSEVGA
ncbi:MAG: GNAT family N-acetyltransferase [Pseudomonadota bacterium]